MSLLPLSRAPQILRLHTLQSYQRSRFTSMFISTLSQILNHEFLQKLQSFNQIFPILKQLLPDIYFTYITIIKSKRRLGEEYTYVTMYKQKHYQEEGVLVNKKYRLIIFLLQILSRNFVMKIMQKVQNTIHQKVMNNQSSLFNNSLIKSIIKSLGNTTQILNNFQWFFIMLFMLNITKSPNFIDIITKISYVYTFFNEKQTKISYKIQGLLLLSVFIIKFIKFIISIRKQMKNLQEQQIKILKKNNKKASKKESELQLNQSKQQISKQQSNQSVELCRICYSQIQQISSTKCGHTFCWKCIIKSLEYNPECPVCRTKCLPREVIQLVNY